MIKFKGCGPGGQDRYLFGLTRGNIDRLVAGQPIVVELTDMGGPNLSIGILFGEDEAAIIADLKAHGVLPADFQPPPPPTPGMAEVVMIRHKRKEHPDG